MNQNVLILLAVVVAGVVAIAGTEGAFSPWETILGFILLLLLAGVNPASFPFSLQLAFLSIAGLCLIIALGYPVEKYLLSRWRYFDIPHEKEESEKRHQFFFIAWMLISFIALPLFLVIKYGFHH
ncbi:MAG: hypothetical protein WBG50_16245 [Desulfomonilaceae bacterium]